MNELTENQKHALCKTAIEAKNDLEWRYLELGGILHQIKEQRAYEAGWSSWEEFAMELKMNTASISRILRIYEVFVLQHKISTVALAKAGGWTVLGDLLPVINNETPKARVKELLVMAAEQPNRKSVILNVKDIIRGAPCKHEHTHTITIEICDDCNERWRVDESE